MATIGGVYGTMAWPNQNGYNAAPINAHEGVMGNLLGSYEKSLDWALSAKPLMMHQGAIIMATAKVGKGTVFAVGDPWLYNEYTDGRKLPGDYQNYQAAKDLSQWLLNQAKSRK